MTFEEFQNKYAKRLKEVDNSYANANVAAVIKRVWEREHLHFNKSSELLKVVLKEVNRDVGKA